jgi:hypothetical protein
VAAAVLIALATVRRLKESAKLQGHKQPLFVEINGQRLPTPHHLYTGKTIQTSNPLQSSPHDSVLWQAISGTRCAHVQAGGRTTLAILQLL